MPVCAGLTSLRVVCNNTLSASPMNRQHPHMLSSPRRDKIWEARFPILTNRYRSGTGGMPEQRPEAKPYRLLVVEIVAQDLTGKEASFRTMAARYKKGGIVQISLPTLYLNYPPVHLYSSVFHVVKDQVVSCFRIQRQEAPVVHVMVPEGGRCSCHTRQEHGSGNDVAVFSSLQGSSSAWWVPRGRREGPY